MAEITMLDQTIRVDTKREEDYLSLTDIARYKNAERTDDLIRKWLRNRNTLEYLGIWEQLNNPDFNPVEFDGIKKQSERLQKLNTLAINQMTLLTRNNESNKQLGSDNKIATEPSSISGDIE